MRGTVTNTGINGLDFTSINPTGTLVIGESNGTVFASDTHTVVPEPSTSILLLGLGALGLSRHRRRLHGSR